MSTQKGQEVTVEPLLFPLDQTRARLGGLSKTKIYAEMASGDLEFVQIGDKRYTTEDQQRDFISRKMKRGREAAS